MPSNPEVWQAWGPASLLLMVSCTARMARLLLATARSRRGRPAPCRLAPPDAAHVEVRNLHNLGEREDAGAGHGAQLLGRDGRQRLDEQHDRLAVQPARVDKQTVELLHVHAGHDLHGGQVLLVHLPSGCRVGQAAGQGEAGGRRQHRAARGGAGSSSRCRMWQRWPTGLKQLPCMQAACGGKQSCTCPLVGPTPAHPGRCPAARQPPSQAASQAGSRAHWRAGPCR